MANNELPMIAKVGEERKITVYKSIDTLIKEAGGIIDAAGSISFAHSTLSFFLIEIVPGGRLVYVATAASLLYKGGLKFDKARGIKGFNITYTYRYEFKYGDPTTLPRWKVVSNTMVAVK